MIKKFKNSFNQKMLSLAAHAMVSSTNLKTKKGDTQLIVLVLLLAVVAVAVLLFRDKFMAILNTALSKLGETFNNLFTS